MFEHLCCSHIFPNTVPLYILALLHWLKCHLFFYIRSFFHHSSLYSQFLSIYKKSGLTPLNRCMGIIAESIIQNALTYRCISPYSVFYFTTSVQMKHFQYVIHKPECFIQPQVVILKVLMIITSAVTEPR